MDLVIKLTKFIKKPKILIDYIGIKFKVFFRYRNNFKIRIKKLPLGINLAGYIESEKGLGVAMRSSQAILNAAGVTHNVVNFCDLGSMNIVKAEKTKVGKKTLPVNLIHVNLDQMDEFHAEKGNKYFKGKYNIGYCFWELSELPEEYVRNFSYFHEVWTATSFAANAFSEKSPVPVVRMPLAIVPRIKTKTFFEKHDVFTFLFVFDLHSLIERKNPLGTLRAFKMAFPGKTGVRLIIKCSHVEGNEEHLEKIKKEAEGYPVEFIEGVLSEQELVSLFEVADCYVSLHRGEGFGLTLAESMAMGKPCIATAYSGNMDFMNINNSYLVKYKMVKISEDQGPYKAGYLWADPDIEDAARWMKHVFENPEEAWKMGQKAAKDIQENFSAQALAGMYRERIERIGRWIK